MSRMVRVLILLAAMAASLNAVAEEMPAAATKAAEIKKQIAELRLQAVKVRAEVLKHHEEVKPFLAQLAAKDREQKAVQAELEAKIGELSPAYKTAQDKLKALDAESQALKAAK
jgi:chromosome segregation ATPase